GPPGPYSHIVLNIDLKSRLFEIREYYKTDPHFLEKRKRNIADSEGFTAYEYKDEDWNNTGLGRVTAASRKTANDNGIVVYEYEYHPGADDISRKVGYSDPERQIAVTAFEYDTEGAITVVEDYYASGRLHTKVDSDRAIYEYLDENSDGNNRARLIKETRPDSSYKVYEDYYEGSDQAEQIKDHDSEGVLLLSKEFDITGQLVEMSIFDNRTRVIRKIHNNKTYTEFYFDDIGELVNYFEYDNCGGITIFDAAGILIYKFNPSEIDAASIEGDSLVSVTNAAGDVIKYQDGKIFSITFRENNATLARIELDNNDALKNAILRYDDGSLGVIYEGKTIQTMFTNGTLVRYRENYKTTEYSPGNSITNFYYCADNDGNLAGIRTDNEQATSLYDANGVPLRFEKINGEISEYNNGYLSRIKTGSGEYFYEFIESTSPTVRFVGTCSEKSIPAVVQYDEDGGINTITDIDGNTMAYIDGLIESITNDSETTTYDYAFTGFNEVETLSVDRSGIERLYDSLGNLQSVTLDKTTSIVYENGSLKYLEKSDGTTIEDLTFTDNGDINDALISCPDGSVAVYSDGELLEIISASGDRIYFSSGNIETITLNNGQSYNWSYDNALIKIYDQTLNEYRWYAEGVLQKIEEGANTQLVTEYVYDDSNKLISSIISRDSQILYTYSYTYENDLTLIHDEDGNIQAYGPDKKLVHLTDSKGCKFTYTYVNNDNEYIKVAMPDLTFVEYDMNGNIIEIVRPDGFTIKDVILNEDDVIKGYTYVYEMIQHVIWEDKISQVITEDGSIKNYDVNGFMTSLIPVEDKIKTFRYLIDDCASVRSEEAILNHTLTNLAIEGASIHLETPFDYGSGNDGVLIVNAGEIIHIDGIKEYDSVYVAEDGILVLDEWNGTTGGQAILRSKGSVMIEGTIDASAKGFRGGINNPSTNRAYGENPAGGSYNGIGLETRDNNYGGGGGGKDGYNQQPDAPGGSGGGGGGYGTDGGCGCNETYRGYDGHGYAGEAYGDEPLTDFYMGSGGGAGGDHSLMGNNGGNGGTGGGALKIVAPEITISGMICANGSAGKDGGDGAAGGGGGSGGKIWLSGEHINVSDGSLQVNGGVRGGGSGAGGPGGAGGLGRMRLDYAEFTGTLPEIPTLYTNQIESITGGELASAIIETSAVRYDTIIWTENSAPGTGILFYTRTGDTSIPDETWSEWSESVTDPSGSKIMSPAGKYIQYKASFQANNSLITPSIDFGYNRGISFSYQRGQNDPDDSEKVNTIIITENDQTSIYNSDGMNINDPNDFIDTSSLFFDSSDIVNLLNSRLPLYLLNETQRVLYLTDDIVISELSEITSVENNVTQYMQGVISKIKFENGSTISDIKFSKNCLPTNYLYVNSSVNKEYVVENSKIAKITDPSDTELIFNDAGFVSSIISTDNEVTTYEYLINDSKAAESMDDFSYNANEILYDQISAQIDLEFDYGDGSGGELIVPPGQTVYVDDTEEYESIYVAAGGTLAVNSWNGVSGGSTELKVKGTVFIDGVITAAGSGYRGGINDPANNRNNGPNPSGESYEGGFTIGPAPNYGGGGGGTDGDNSQPDASNGGGGAGGGYGTPGTNGSPESYNNEQLQGYGGDAYCEFRIDTLSLGSGGGAGGDHPLVGTPGGNGGGGGGAIKIFAPEIVINGQITADGEAGQDGGGNGAAGGGGGSGGTIWLAAETINITSGTISVNGGEGGNSSGAGGPGGAGGLGRIRLDYISFIGELPYTATLYANPQPGIVSKEIVSEAILTGALEYDTISWAENLPAGTDITFLTRTGGVPAPDSTWSDWSSALTNPAGSDITSPSANYIQYKAVLTTTNPDASPVLYLNDTQNIHITYTRAPKTCGDIRNLSLITASHNGSTTIYNADGVCTTDPGNVIGIADISFDVEEMADIADRIAPHLLNSSQKIITVYDKTTDAVLKTISAGHTITNFENGYVTNVKDKTGSVLVEYMYDENYMIIKTNFVNARAKLEEGYQNTLADLAMQKDEALEQLEQSRLNAVKNIELEVTRIQQQIDAERERILIAKSRYDSSIFDLSEFDKVLREIDQYEIDLHLQQIEAYTNLNEQIAQAEIDIELDAAQAMQSLLADDYNTVLGDIVWKESSPVIYAYYRSVLGRDPGLP
ncbi:MAG: hypothetical protein KKC50_08510, partial [Candidatus Omnitrophica bacterium]|nr:hypothetical protein [Candidatus Omnitrophota bacterium]